MGKKKNLLLKKKNLLLFLPDELIVEILLRLPVKSILRFKCVCKSWFSLISDPQFAKSHFDLASNRPTNTLFYVVTSGSEARWLDFSTSIKYDCAVVTSPLPDYDYNFVIRGSCRGFILLENYPNLILWNPVPVASKFLKKFYGTSTNYDRELWCGFGYDSSRDDYLVVIGWHDFGATNLKTRFEFYSVRTNSWKQIEGTNNFCYHGARNQAGFFFNGAVHWLAYSRDSGSVVFPDNAIIAFDLKTRNLSMISAPTSLARGAYYNLLEVEGCLGGWCWGIHDTEIWVMKKYKVQSSWAKKTVAFPHDTSKISPLCFTEGGELVATNNDGNLVKFNDMGKLLQLRPDFHYRHLVAMYTATLLSFPGDLVKAKEEAKENEITNNSQEDMASKF